MEGVTFIIFVIIFIVVMALLSFYVSKQDKKTIGELHIYSNGEGNPPTWNFTLKKDVNINKVSDIHYAVFKVVKEDV